MVQMPFVSNATASEPIHHVLKNRHYHRNRSDEEFFFIQGNDGYQDEWKLKIVCPTEWAVYFERDKDDDADE